jgi:ubiquinol-cytochrome c reductase cytochrome b subunit
MNKTNKFIAWLDARLPVLSFWRSWFSEYYVPKNLNFYYYFGSLALLVLFNQLVSGLWLAMFYTPTVMDAFNSIEYIMRDVNYGWLLRYLHTTGASAFFIVLYVHIFRGLLYGSYQKPRELVWILGFCLFILLIAEAFFGYLLPWGQMSYWGAQVITSLLSVIPYIGDTLVVWLRGDYSLNNPGLQRFFALHVIGLPLLVIGLVFLHLCALHRVGSNNPLGIEITDKRDLVPFYPYYVLKDFLGIMIFLFIFFAIVFFVPDMGGYFLESENFAAADLLSTPEHIKPMWYMAPFYAILRAIPNKSCGVMCMLSSLIILLFLPWMDKSPVRALRYKGVITKIFFWSGILSFVILGFLGMLDVTPFRIYLARLCLGMYFAYFLLMPLYTRKNL